MGRGTAGGGHSHGGGMGLRSSAPGTKWYEDRALVVIFAVAAIQASFVGVELAVALITDSLSLLSDGLHNLGDVASLGLGGGALIFSKRAASATMTFGWRRAELVGGLINGVLIVGMQSVIALQALDRFFEPSDTQANTAFFITTTLSLVVNIVGAFMLSAAGVAHSHSHGGEGGGHSHGGDESDGGHGHGGHGHGGEKKKDKEGGGHGHSHGDKKEKEGGGHGHSHGEKKEKKEGGGHGHSHGSGGDESSEGGAAAAASSGGGHGHSHGDKKKDKEGGGHGHSHGDKEKKEGGGHGHSHGDKEKKDKEGGGHGHSHGDKKEKSGHGHAHGSEKSSLLGTGEPKKKELNENFRIMIIHLIGDGLGCIVVLITGLIIRFTTWKWKVYADAIGSLLISAIIFYASWDVIKESAYVLLQRVPPGVNVDDLRKKVRAVTGVIGVHELHVWQLVDAAIVGSCHVKCREGDNFTRIGQDVKAITHTYGMHSFTIQPEFLKHVPGCDAIDNSGDCNCKEDEEASETEICVLSCAENCEETEDLCCSPAPGSPAPIRRSDSPRFTSAGAGYGSV